ncbi:hypothetical protein ISALK_01705 [Isachenkonia alkalipeptolytica]|uniref:Uncharacterized protein n=1 Tax=Isachenkonia alkalipeptolytica TaxID=2565777 RepID=A0AA44BCP9_9CLOT|nr:hypothetical protein [Isachenkonia alkalipeptolytica]
MLCWKPAVTRTYFKKGRWKKAGSTAKPQGLEKVYVDVKDLLKDGARVLENLTKVEKEVKGKEGRWYLMKIIPYRTSDDRIKGIVIRFDIVLLLISGVKK